MTMASNFFVLEQLWHVLQTEVDVTTTAWSHYKEFTSDRDELADCHWDEMRNQLHRVDDFVAKWSKAAEALDKSSMKLTLLREVAGYHGYAV